MSIVIGLTGNIACGKSLAGKIFEKHGIPVIDSDDIVHSVYAEDKMVQDAVLKEFGSLDKKEIAKQIFGDDPEKKQKRKILESLIHPAVDKRLRTWIREHNDEKVLVNLVPLIFEANLEQRYNYVVTVCTDEGLQRERLRSRNPEMTEEEIERRIKSQMPQTLKAKKSHFVLYNNSSPEALEEQIIKLLQGF